MRNLRRAGGRAFTLIELLVVVAIIALLIAILLPSLGRAREKAKTVRCQVTMRTIWQGVNLYATDWGGWMMPYKIQGSGKNSYWYAPVLLGSYWSQDSKNVNTNINWAYKLLYCPSTPPPSKDSSVMSQLSYSYNANFGDSSNVTAGSGATPKIPFRKITTLVSIETHGGDEKGDHDYYFTQMSDVVDNSNDVTKWGTTPLAGHPHEGGKKGNMLFMDGQIILDDPFKMKSQGIPNHLYIVDPFPNTTNPLWGNRAPFPYSQ
jgi:prepilin-type N-terminal cleavage/methylation domain-containing protein/prepilin-type processing-associated H-X9-DG protein